MTRALRREGGAGWAQPAFDRKRGDQCWAGRVLPGEAEDVQLAQLGKGRLVLSAENHSVVGGLFDTVARTVVTHGLGEKITPIGLPDEFLEAGALPTLNDRYGMSAEAIVERVHGLL